MIDVIRNEKKKQSQKRYLKTVKGMAARRRAIDKYNHSAKGRICRLNYLRSSKGKEAVDISKRKYDILHG